MMDYFFHGFTRAFMPAPPDARPRRARNKKSLEFRLTQQPNCAAAFTGHISKPIKAALVVR